MRKRARRGVGTVGVFEVIEEIEEVDARVGDHFVVGREEVWPVSLARELSYVDARWALHSEHARLEFTLPYETSVEDAMRELHESFPYLYLLH